jgi:ParB family transcriptional regulator, chromosome partitioning protein
MSKLMKNKPRLGRGLSSLLSMGEAVEREVAPEADGAPATAMEGAPPPPLPVVSTSPLEIPLASVIPNPHQPRKKMNDAAISELAASLKSTGLIQPIVVRQVGEAYELIAGERRWRAAKLAGLTTIPAIIRVVDSFTQAQMALVENIQRENLNPIDRAQAYRTLMSQLGLTQAELAGRLGEDRSTIANHLRLLDLAEPIQSMLIDGRLSLGHAKILAGVPDILEQERLANLVVSQELSVRNLERLLQDQATATPTPERSAASSPSAHLMDLEKSLTRQLGLRVQVRSAANKKKGRLILHYASLDQFDELLNRLGVKPE